MVGEKKVERRPKVSVPLDSRGWMRERIDARLDERLDER
jgi:hypothetical protein